ncbi:hypothetical protein G4B88_009754 [Cannabis sativa]|uniref:RNase H type-1 domain-containing protein n=1 Tax=Cannabis sativa TaxID=3483 RepID=A0A7J6DPK8_CANSA|nr:hypothetical protein G4B88_009754 [Cannabis sativa]
MGVGIFPFFELTSSRIPLMTFCPSLPLIPPNQTPTSGSTPLLDTTRNQDSRSETIEQEAHDYLDFYQAAQDKRGNHTQSTSDRDLLDWEPPLNRTGGGALVRDHTGEVIAATAFNRIGQLHPQAAEGWALLEALKWCHDKGININQVEVDCKNLLTDLQSSNENLTSFGNLIKAIRRLLSSFPTVTLHHTRRQGNTAAHNLAQMSIGLDNTWSWNSQDPYPFPL